VPSILIVDDEADNRYLLETILQNQGYATVSAENGAEALRLAGDQVFDLVLSDILMPVMDGFTLCHAWKQDRRLARIPFAFYTATYTEPRDEQFAMDLGADRFLFKPLPPEVILQEVQDLLGRGPRDRTDPGRVDPETAFLAEHNTALFRKLEKKLAENERLEAGNARFGRMLSASLNEIFVFSGEDLRFGYVNQGALRHLGYDEASMRELTPLDLTGLSAGSFQDLLKPLREGAQEKQVLETAFRKKDGSSYPVEVHLEPMLDGTELTFLAIVQDITERRRQALEQRRLQAEILHSQKLESLGRMASSVAHDMNNLLTPILAMASVLQELHGGDVLLRKQLGAILRAAEQGRDLVSGLTEYARKGILALREVDLNALIRKDAELLMASTAPAIRWELDMAEGLPTILGDPLGLSRMLMNLCKNAIDAMPGGGVLRLSTRPMASRWVELLVIDSGAGIPPEVLSRVLEPFYTTKDGGKGTGLGLAIVDTIIRSHAGTLEIRSQEGQGTTIQVHLPVR